MGSIHPPVVPFEEIERDPHGAFKRFRRHVPIIMRPDGVRIVLRAADVRRLGSDPRLATQETSGLRAGPLLDFWRNAMLFSNGEAHARRRAPFAKPFAFPTLAPLRAEVAAVANALADRWTGLDRVDLVADFANQLPLLVISKILGVPDADMPRAMGLICSVARILSGTAGIDDIPQIEHDVRLLLGGFRRLADDRRRSGRDDLLGACLASQQGAALSAAEMIAQLALIFIAATETTRTSLASLIVLLLEHRDQWDAVVGDPACRKSAVIEGLRFEPGVAYFARTPREDIEVQGCIVPAGTTVILSALSAMRDESVFENADAFDIFRGDLPKSVIVFGAGPHRCLGEALALIVMEEGLGALASRLPGLKRVGPRPVVFGSASVRHITPVHVSWR